jgi:hypothetical protein
MVTNILCVVCIDNIVESDDVEYSRVTRGRRFLNSRDDTHFKDRVDDGIDAISS